MHIPGLITTRTDYISEAGEEELGERIISNRLSRFYYRKREFPIYTTHGKTDEEFQKSIRFCHVREDFPGALMGLAKLNFVLPEEQRE